jgi:hypothetical protein
MLINTPARYRGVTNSRKGFYEEVEITVLLPMFTEGIIANFRIPYYNFTERTAH